MLDEDREIILKALLEAWELIQPDHSEDVSETFKSALKIAKDYDDQR